jgi:hypothetical protein
MWASTNGRRHIIESNDHTVDSVTAPPVSPRPGDGRSLSRTRILALQLGDARSQTRYSTAPERDADPLPTIRPISAAPFPRNRPTQDLFNPHRSGSGSVQRILSVVPATQPLIRSSKIRTCGHCR